MRRASAASIRRRPTRALRAGHGRAKRLVRIAEARGEIPHRLQSARIALRVCAPSQSVEARHCVRKVVIRAIAR